MVFIKKVKSGSKTYYYLVQSYRVDNNIFQKTIKRLTPEEASDPNFVSDFLVKNPKYQKTGIKAIIPAAGKSIRLFPYSQDLPKGLIPLDNKKILRYIIDALQTCGITDIILITGFQDEGIRSNFEGETKIVHNPFYTVSGILASLWFAIHEMDSPLFVIYSDLLFEETIIEDLLQDKNDISVAITSTMADGVTEKAAVKNGYLTEIGIDIPNRPENSDYAGITKFSAKGAVYLRETIEEMAREEGFLNFYFTAALERLMLKGHSISTKKISPDFWIDINTPQDLQRAERVILPNIKAKKS
ncbi:MAG: NTP transferase domain-containing protein [Candidatus Hodarchaeota archaeon]